MLYLSCWMLGLREQRMPGLKGQGGSGGSLVCQADSAGILLIGSTPVHSRFALFLVPVPPVLTISTTLIQISC